MTIYWRFYLEKNMLWFCVSRNKEELIENPEECGSNGIFLDKVSSKKMAEWVIEKQHEAEQYNMKWVGKFNKEK